MDIAANIYIGIQDSQPDIDACIASGANTPVSGMELVERGHSSLYQNDRLRLLTYDYVTEMQRHSLRPRRKKLLLLPECIDNQ